MKHKESFTADAVFGCVCASQPRKFYCERSYGAYSRRFDVSGVNTEEIKAQYKDGVLKLTMPKKNTEPPSSRHLEIE